jgi:hypothetical protein
VILSNTFTKTHSTKILNGMGGKLNYDKEKYKEMLLDAAETVLGYFRFDRTVYGNKKNNNYKEMAVVGRIENGKRKRYQDRNHGMMGINHL